MATLTPRQRSHARSLRRDDTSTEQRLWTALRYRRLNGVKFVRQLPIGPYIADFACRAAKLIVEVDGATHSAEEDSLPARRVFYFVHMNTVYAHMKQQLLLYRSNDKFL